MTSTVLKILQRTLINTFYKANTGFFLFCFFMLFGVVQPVIGYHLSLIQGMIQDFVFLGCVIGAWFLYTCKCINYIGTQFKEPRNDFLQVLNKLSPAKQYFFMLWVHLQVYMPVFIYACIVTVIAGKQSFYMAMVLVIISNLFLILLSALLYRHFLQKKGFRVLRWLPVFPSFKIRKPLFALPLWFIWKNRKQMLLVTKTFTFLVIYIFAMLYEPEQHDIRPVQLILLLISMAHAAIVLQVRQFEEEYLGFSRGLPIRFLQRFVGLIIIYTILLLPELLFIWKAYPAAFLGSDYPQLLLFTISLPVFFHSILLMEDLDTESYMRLVFATSAVLFFVTFYDPGIVLPLAVIILSFVFFHAHFYTFEKRHT